MNLRRPSSTTGHVRLIGGRWRGTRLAVSDLPGLRPTSDRVRETLFNWLQPVLPNARVLDLFAGSGALGLEAVSRGARQALLVERDPTLVGQLHATIERLQAEGTVSVCRADVMTFLQLPLHGRFDVVFVDPPFSEPLWLPTLRALTPWLAQPAWLYVESPLASAVTPDAPWLLHRQGQTREVHYALYRSA